MPAVARSIFWAASVKFIANRNRELPLRRSCTLTPGGTSPVNNRRMPNCCTSACPRSSVNRVFQTSVEVGVKVFVENYIADTSQHVASAYLTFVAIDGAGRRLKVAPAIPESEEQQRRYDDAGRRREIRRTELERRRKAKR